MDLSKFYRKTLLKGRIEKIQKRDYESIYCTVGFCVDERKKISYVHVEENSEKEFYDSLEEQMIALEKRHSLPILDRISFGVRDNTYLDIPIEFRSIRGYLFQRF